MPTLITKSALVVSLAILPALALAQQDDASAEDAYGELEVTADGPAPAWTPPPPAEQPAAPQAQPSAQVPPGQWVHTQQYGWIWMPYADAYTQVPANGWGEPYAYVYYPAYSTWTWVAAPWVWGYGPWPVFGVWGPARFAWYGHGWWRSPARWHYAPTHRWHPGGPRVAPSYSRSAGWAAPRFAPSRGGLGAFRGSAGGGPATPGHALRGGGHGHGGGREGGNGHGSARGGGHGRW